MNEITNTNNLRVILEKQYILLTNFLLLFLTTDIWDN